MSALKGPYVSACGKVPAFVFSVPAGLCCTSHIVGREQFFSFHVIDTEAYLFDTGSSYSEYVVDSVAIGTEKVGNE